MFVIKICVYCGKAFEVDDLDRNRNRRKFCGIDCAEQGAYQRKREYAKNGKDRARSVKCEICGKIFRTSYSQKVTCSPECKKERSRRLAYDWNRARREGILNGTRPAPGQNKPKQKRVETVEDIQRKAREAGMSYGQYTALLYMQKEGMRNGRC